ncbi:MAG: hypothetical protein LLG06_19820 [Desulfobacteraceae bacterium]|nr:hypothetical protein [Desulfobacteraceae bacterium]
MTAPSQPTKTTICTEALKRALNGGTPEAADITRAEDYGLEKVKRDIMALGKTWKPLLRIVYDITKVGVPSYANPADFEQDFTVGLMNGTHTGALTTVTSTSIVDLAADEDVTQAQAEGKYLLITSGTGVDQAQIIDDYNATTKRATMAAAYATLCVTGDGYMVANSIAPLRKIPLALYNLYQHPGVAGTPAKFTQIENQTVGELALYPVPNAVFGLQRHYYADLMKLDMALDLYSTILRRWAAVLEQGVYVWKLGEDDNRYDVENQAYQALLIGIMKDDLAGFDPEKLANVAKQG